MVILALRLVPDLKNHGTKPATAPSDGAKLLRVLIPLINQIRLIENLLRFLQADTVFQSDIPALPGIKLQAHNDLCKCYTMSSLDRRRRLPAPRANLLQWLSLRIFLRHALNAYRFLAYRHRRFPGLPCSW